MDIGLSLLFFFSIGYFIFLTDKSRNPMWGFRTKLSKKSPQNWKCAQHIFYLSILITLGATEAVYRLTHFPRRIYYVLVLLCILATGIFTQVMVHYLSARHKT